MRINARIGNGSNPATLIRMSLKLCANAHSCRRVFAMSTKGGIAGTEKAHDIGGRASLEVKKRKEKENLSGRGLDNQRGVGMPTWVETVPGQRICGMCEWVPWSRVKNKYHRFGRIGGQNIQISWN